QVALGFVGNYAPRGLSPQMFDMPVIQKKRGTIKAPRSVISNVMITDYLRMNIFTALSPLRTI
ncbi:MAG: hypothetical protein K2L46_04630, partial [Paramuribaculum sp.]|nr:hypothetical protein [Paramuribaculum sp.]